MNTKTKILEVASDLFSKYGYDGTSVRDIAKMADCRSARAVGFALNRLPEGSDIPWQRIINSQGGISTRVDGYGDSVQKVILEKEGIEFINDKVNLKKYRWQAK